MNITAADFGSAALRVHVFLSVLIVETHHNVKAMKVSLLTVVTNIQRDLFVIGQQLLTAPIISPVRMNAALMKIVRMVTVLMVRVSMTVVLQMLTVQLPLAASVQTICVRIRHAAPMKTVL